MADAPLPTLTPLQPPPDWVPGRYASFPISSEPMYGPDELGHMISAIDDMTETATRADSSARMWEVLQAWEAQLFARGYQFLNAGRKGWGFWGGVNGSSASGAEVMQTQNQGKLFPCNVYGARLDKVVSILSSDTPSLTFVPEHDDDPIDQTAADEKNKYIKVWMNQSAISAVVRKTADIFYTDGRAVYWTNSWADEQEWGTETPTRQQEAFGMPEPEGLTPENELAPPATGGDKPAVRELTLVFDKLQCKVPIYADSQGMMPWVRVSTEVNCNILKERYPWIEPKIVAGGQLGGSDQLDRQARIMVRLAVQTTSSTGESWQQDGTETFTWYRPSQYRAIKDKETRQIFFATFPKGLLVCHATAEFAFCRNESLNEHIRVVHAKEGPGQNRRAIGTNYLPMQKVLNAEFNLIDRHHRNVIARRFHDAEAINSEAINGQTNDPAKSTPVLRKTGESIADYTGIETVPQLQSSIFEFVQWLIQGAPEVLDGMEPAMFGGSGGEADQGVYQTAKLKRDAARGIYQAPWSQICFGLAKAAEQASMCAASNRQTDIASNIPGQGKMVIELAKMGGGALCYPETLEIPQTIAEQELQMANLIEGSANIPLYAAIVNDPRNLSVIAQFPSMANLTIPGVDPVEQQQGELEQLMKSGPLPNPQLAAIEQQIQQGMDDPEAQTPQGQQALQQLQQAAQQMPPMVSSVPVAQNGSENHAIHAAITLGMMESAEGRKLKNGDADQQAKYANLELHWQEHEQMKEKLTPVKPLEVKASATVSIDKLPPNVQAQALQAMGVQAMPSDFEDTHELVPHEVVTEREGMDEHGVPVKQKIAMVNPAGKLT